VDGLRDKVANCFDRRQSLMVGPPDVGGVGPRPAPSRQAQSTPRGPIIGQAPAERAANPRVMNVIGPDVAPVTPVSLVDDIRRLRRHAGERLGPNALLGPNGGQGR